jgi:hypothetical protein
MVDSKKKQLSIPDIVMQAVHNNPMPGIPPHAAILGIVKESTLPNTESVRYGNTLFIAHFSKDRDLAVGRALNVDTASNFVSSGEEYFRDLVKRGTTKYVTQFYQKSYAMGFTALKRKPITTKMQIWVLDTPKGETQVRIAFDGELT